MASSPRRSIPTVDRISDLPDSILCHILSFLPSEQAAATTILSKSWKRVWLSTLTLHFDDKTFKDFKSFHEFVYSTMFKLRDKKTPIYSFSLKLGNSSRFNQEQFNRIFKFVMERGCVNLDFNMDAKMHLIKLPHCVISLKSLQVLKLTKLAMRDFDHVDFPQIKALSLDRVEFKSREYFVKFLFGCPVLEDLYAGSIIYQLGQSSVPSKNYDALPNLVKVTIFDELDYIPMTLVCKAKILHSEQSLFCSTRLPVFHNLTHMEFGVHDIFSKKNCAWLLGILRYFPKLQHFIIQDFGDENNICSYRWMHPHTTAPECISSQLKTCCIKSYKGTIHQFEFAKYIMQHSKVLETMIVSSSTSLLKDQKDQMLLKLSSCPRGSTTCKLLFD